MNTRRAWLLLAAGLVLIAGLAGAADPPVPAPVPAPLPSATGKWTRVRTDHFTLYGNASVRRITDFGVRLERFRTMVAQFNKSFSTDLHVPVTIFVFETEADYGPYKERVGGRPTDHIGYYLSVPDAAFVTMLANSNADPLDIIYHEFTHAFLDVNLPTIPAWFNEGLAECYSTFRATDDDRAEIGRPVDHHVQLLRSNPLIPLPDLFRVNHDSPDYNETARSGIFYAQSWALVHYLMWGSPDRRGQIGAFLAGLHNGQSIDAAFSAAFKSNFTTLEAELSRYIEANRFSFSVVTFKKLAVERSAMSAPAPRDEVLSRLGDLLRTLAEGSRHGDARRHYEEAIRLNPRHAPSLAGLAALLEGKQGRQEALELLERAAAIDPADDRVALLLARTLIARSQDTDNAAVTSGSSTELARARSLLDRVIARQPGLVEPQALLGTSYLEQTGDLGRGITAFETALRMTPGRLDLMSRLVLLYLRNGERQKAGAFVDKVVANSADQPLLAWAREALEGYDASHPPTLAAARPLPPPLESDPGPVDNDPASPEVMESLVASDRPLSLAEAQARRSAWQADRQRSIDDLEAKLPGATDPDARRTLQDKIDKLRTSYTAADHQYHIAVYNHAVKLANDRQLRQAIALLEKVLPEIGDRDLAKTTRDLIARLRADAARLGLPKP